MKKLFINIFIFILPVLLLVLIFPIDKRLRYTSLKDDCFNHGIWVHDRIFKNEAPADIVFFGSSHTISAIDEKMIEDSLRELNIHVANLGYCRLGRNLSYALLKETLKNKKPEMVIVEVMENEDHYSHPIFPFIAEEKDVFLSYPFFNPDIIEDDYNLLAYKIQLMQEVLFTKNEEVPIDFRPYGFATHSDTASSKLLADQKEKRSKPVTKENKLEHDFHMQFPWAYLKKIAELCTENNIKLSFLYMPGYGICRKLPAEAETYKSYGELLLPPDSIFENVNNWHDENHLNKNGAAEISSWVSKQIFKHRNISVNTN